MTNNVSQTWSTIERVKDGSRLFSRNVFCEEQNVGVRLPRSKVLKAVGEGAGGAHDCRTVTPGLNGLLEPPKTVSAFTVVASENFTDFSVTTE